MSLTQFILFVAVAVLHLASATPFTKLTTRAPSETAGSNRRGVAYNNISFVKFFDIYGSHVSWYFSPPLTSKAQTLI